MWPLRVDLRSISWIITGLLHLLPFNEKIDQIGFWDSSISLWDNSEIVQKVSFRNAYSHNVSYSYVPQGHSK